MSTQMDNITFISTEQEFQDFLKTHKKSDRFSFECKKCGNIVSFEKRSHTTLPLFCKTCKTSKIKSDTPITVDSLDDLESKRQIYTQTQLVSYTCAGCGSSSTVTLRAIKSYPIYCKTCSTKSTNLKRYGYECAQKSEVVQQKRIKTCTEKYGGVLLGSKELADKIHKTNMENYGVENPMQNTDISQKARNTFIERYGKEFLTEAVRAACLDKYGVENPMQVESIVNKALETKKDKYGESFFKNIILESSRRIYGTDNPMQADVVKQKAIATLKQKYGDDFFTKRMSAFFEKEFGVANAMQVPEIAKRAWDSKLEKYGSPENFPNAVASHKKFMEYRLDETTNLDIEWLDSESFRGKYNNGPIYYKFRCIKCGSIFEDDFHSGVPVCRVCHPSSVGVSNQEDELYNYIQSIYSGEIIRHDRHILNGKELDMFFPELNIAIEYNGTYWHGYRRDTIETVGVFKRNVEWKRVECEKQGIRLVTIDEADYQDRPEVFNRFLQDLLLPRKRVFARKCEVREIPDSLAKEFCEYYHVNGFKGGYCKLGLFYKDELLVVAIFGKHQKYQNECIRLVYKTGYDVIGGWAKIIAHFGKPFLHYVNLKYFRGENKTGCGYRFWIKGRLVYRQQLQRKNLHNYCSNINPDISDFKNCLNNGGIAIFDVGNDIRLYNQV